MNIQMVSFLLPLSFFCWTIHDLANCKKVKFVYVNHNKSYEVLQFDIHNDYEPPEAAALCQVEMSHQKVSYALDLHIDRLQCGWIRIGIWKS